MITADQWYNRPPLDDYKNLMAVVDRVEREQAEFLGTFLYELLRPTSVVDWGCASGLYLVPFRKHGVRVLGLDAEATAGRLLMEGVEFHWADFRGPVEIEPGGFDLALCIEVAEHLQPDYADQLVDNVARSAELVFWSAAKPGQPGQNHYNCQPWAYWESKFKAHGFRRHELDGMVRLAILGNPHCQRIGWLPNNCHLLEREV